MVGATKHQDGFMHNIAKLDAIYSPYLGQYPRYTLIRFAAGHADRQTAASRVKAKRG